MKPFLLLFLLIVLASVILCSTAKGQTPAFTIISVNSGWDTVSAEERDTVQMWLTYVDSTTTIGSRLLKVNGVYKTFKYRFPVRPEVKWILGYGVRRRTNGEATSAINSYTGVFQSFDCGEYLDELKQPMKKQYFVTSAIGYNEHIYIYD